jgi:hypothetical protein
MPGGLFRPAPTRAAEAAPLHSASNEHIWVVTTSYDQTLSETGG